MVNMGRFGPQLVRVMGIYHAALARIWLTLCEDMTNLVSEFFAIFWVVLSVFSRKCSCDVFPSVTGRCLGHQLILLSKCWSFWLEDWI